MKKNIFRIFLAAIIMSVVSSMFLAFNAANEMAWDLVNYDFSSAPSGTINEGTVSDGLLKFEGKKSFYTAPAATTTGKISSEISLRAVSGWVNVCYTNKISAQGYRIQVRADGDVLLFGGPNNGYIDLIGKYDAKNLCKLTVELNLDKDFFSVSLNGAVTKEYKASNVVYYTSNNTDAKGYSRVFVGGNGDDSSAEVDYIKVSSKSSGKPQETTKPETTKPNDDKEFSGKRVACLGDSITFGTAASSPNASYPAQLQKLLGDKYLVGNYGVPGASAVNSGLCYGNLQECRDALAFEPDIVIIMLGANDANPTHGYNLPSGAISQSQLDQHKANYLSIIESFEKLAKKPKIYLIRPTAMTRTVGGAFDESYVENYKENLVKIRDVQKNMAKEKSLTVIDGFAAIDKPGYFADGLHLTDAGYKKLAETVHKAILSNTNQDNDTTETDITETDIIETTEFAETTETVLTTDSIEETTNVVETTTDVVEETTGQADGSTEAESGSESDSEDSKTKKTNVFAIIIPILVAIIAAVTVVIIKKKR